VDVEIAVAYDSRRILQKWFLRSVDLNRVKLTLIENGRDPTGVAKVLNSHKRTSKADWLVFCHQDFLVQESGWVKKISSLEPVCCYGPLGIDRRGNLLGRVRRGDGLFIGQSAKMGEVNTLDESCIIVPRSIYEKIDFDEKVPFDFYVADYCLEAKTAGYSSQVIQLDCHHALCPLARDTESKSYLNGKQLFLEKHRNVRPLLTTTFQVWPRLWWPPENSPTLKTELELVGKRKKVLEIGSGGGHMTEALAKDGCTVTSIEIDPELSQRAKSFCDELFVGDIEYIDLNNKLRDKSFDVILLGDVLEHLKNPVSVLRRLQKFLSDSGYLVVSVPNVSHASVRLALLNGEFPYSDEGLLDRTHVRFFTLKNIANLLYESGYEMSELRRVENGFFDSEVPVDPSKVPVSVLKILVRDPETRTYQYVFTATKKQPFATDSGPNDGAFLYPQQGPRRTKNRLATELRRRGVKMYRYNRLSEAKGMLRKSMALKFRFKTFVYLILCYLGIKEVIWYE
jgi:2-polyprenyl-3-methyl-5-hydroxy-6-metoxy-1,4-benzoquinol methylase